MSTDPKRAASPSGAEEAGYPEKPAVVHDEHQDEALKVLGAYSGDPEWSEEEEKRIRKRLDWRLMPVLSITYGLQHYDKTMLSQAVSASLHPYSSSRSPDCLANLLTISSQM